jgi:hypothetical protein
MKKKLLLFVLLLISGELLAADWDLFPYKQHSYFSDNSIDGKNIVEVFVMDSTRNGGSESVIYFKKDLSDYRPQVCPVISYPMGMPFLNSYENYFDSLVVRGDTVLFYSTYSTTPFYFIPNATVGQTWTTSSTYNGNDYNQITITCSSIDLEQVFDVADSVKTFSLNSNGTSANQLPISNYQIRLSKAHGLLEFIPLMQFHYHPDYFQFKTLKLIGWELNGNKGGYTHSEFEDYFHLSAGDILQWQFDSDPANIMLPNTTDYIRDSILQVIDSPDSLVYLFDQILLNHDSSIYSSTGNRIAYSKSSVNNLLRSLPLTFAYGTIPYSMINDPAIIPYWNSYNIIVTTDSITNDSISEYKFNGSGYFLDTLTCEMNEVTDVGEDFTLNSKYGVSEYCNNSFGRYCRYIIGSRINGITEGEITIGVDELFNSNSSQITLYPNPVDDELFIGNKNNLANPHFEIYDSLGKKVLKGVLIEDHIAINDLSSGMYLLRIENEKKIISSRFIKR